MAGKKKLLILLAVGAAIGLAATVYGAAMEQAPEKPAPFGNANSPNDTADHSKFEALQKEFTSGPEVTRACLSCHNEAAEQFQKTIHWK